MCGWLTDLSLFYSFLLGLWERQVRRPLVTKEPPASSLSPWGHRRNSPSPSHTHSDHPAWSPFPPASPIPSPTPTTPTHRPRSLLPSHQVFSFLSNLNLRGHPESIQTWALGESSVSIPIPTNPTFFTGIHLFQFQCALEFYCQIRFSPAARTEACVDRVDLFRLRVEL